MRGVKSIAASRDGRWITSGVSKWRGVSLGCDDLRTSFCGCNVASLGLVGPAGSLMAAAFDILLSRDNLSPRISSISPFVLSTFYTLPFSVCVDSYNCVALCTNNR